MSYVLQFIVFILALLGVMSKSVKTDEKGNAIPVKFGLLKLTGIGKIIITLLFISFLLSLVTTYNSSKEAKENEVKLKEIEVTLNNLNLGRDISGVEISFKPSPERWSEIARACDKITPQVPGFPYSASTITAERVEDHWNLDFTAIFRQEGSIRPRPVSTNQPGGEGFEEVLNKALVELLIEWDGGVVTKISPGRDYPSSITVSKDKIVFTFNQPKLRLNLGKLKADPTVKFRGEAYPESLSVRSLDNSVMFDETIKLNWEEKSGEIHADVHEERMMPYISGPHRLNITFINLNR